MSQGPSSAAPREKEGGRQRKRERENSYLCTPDCPVFLEGVGELDVVSCADYTCHGAFRAANSVE